MKLIKEVFETPPPHWELRGDPQLWEELSLSFSKIHNTIEPIDFETMLKSAFDLIIAKGKKIDGDTVWFENYDQGGMSGGSISLEWWKRTGIPMLVKRYREM